MDITEVVGLTGSALSSITFIPQVWQAWKTKSVGDLNLTMMLIVATSCLVWLCYGIMNRPMLRPVIICNTIIFLMAVLLIYFKFAFKKPQH